MGRLSFLTDIMAGLLERVPQAGSKASVESLESMAQALLSNRGEVSGMRLARDILARYAGLDQAGRLAFFNWLAKSLDLDPNAVITAAQAYRDAPDRRSYSALAQIAEPPRQELLRRLNQSAGATLDLVRMRLDLLRLLPDHPHLGALDVDFTHLFRSWFNRGFLVLRPIDWRTPANILEKIIEYEAVHTINDWSDLRRRLLPNDRRCFAFFHPAMLEEPLIFVEVALCKGIPGSVQSLLAESRAPLSDDELDTAVFYSISNCQEGLRGISFGNSLIKQVVEELLHELPQLRSFVTLSPIPGLMSHLRSLNTDSARKITAAVEVDNQPALANMADDLRIIAAQWLALEKRKDGTPADPVARFHLGNGAELHQIHAMADISHNGMGQSAGAMVNYLYDLRKVETNHEAFATQDRIVMSKDIRALLQAGTAAGKTKT